MHALFTSGTLLFSVLGIRRTLAGDYEDSLAFAFGAVIFGFVSYEYLRKWFERKRNP